MRIIAIVLLCSIAYCEDKPEVKYTKPVQEALTKMDQSINGAKIVYDRAVDKAKGDCVKALEVELVKITKTGDFNAAAVVKAKIDELNEGRADVLGNKADKDAYKKPLIGRWREVGKVLTYTVTEKEITASDNHSATWKYDNNPWFVWDHGWSNEIIDISKDELTVKMYYNSNFHAIIKFKKVN